MKPLLTVDSISKQFHTTPVVTDVSFEVFPGEIFALLGASGCGKTTTLRLIAGFEKADSGIVTMNKRVLEDKHSFVPPESREIGFVFQDYALFPDKTVIDNAAFGLSRKLKKNKRYEITIDILERVGIGHLKSRMPHHLSGGEQQRVALARSLVTQPKMILLDEPFSNLDAGLRQSTREEVKQLLKAFNISVVLVTHDQEEALSFAERIAVMHRGTIEQIGTPEEIYRKPNTVYVANFLGKTNIIETRIENGLAETPIGNIKVNYPDTPKAILSIRPEHININKVDTNLENKILGHISVCEFKGHDFTYQVDIDGKTYFVQTDYRSQFQVGDIVSLQPIETVLIKDESNTISKV